VRRTQRSGSSSGSQRNGGVAAAALPCYCTSLRNATRRVTSIYDQALAPTGINIAQFSFLRNIERQGGMAGRTRLGELLDLDRSTVGRNARVLERMGLVVLGRSEEDQRETTIELTQSGRRAIQDAVPLWQSVQERVRSRLGEREAKHLLDLLSDF
jgi:DNA-binding MarR family transcriptional regulator